MTKWRKPTQEDLIGKDFIECQVRDDKNEKWENAQLIRVSSLQKAIFPFTVKTTTLKGFVTSKAFVNSKASLNFRFCRIKESVESTTDNTPPKLVQFSPGDIVYIIDDEHREKAKVLLCKHENGEYIYRVQCLEDGSQYSMYWHELELCTKATETPNSSTAKPGYFDDVDGVWVDEPSPFEGRMVVNEKGAKQSFVSVRFDCISPVVLRLLAQCLGFGARKYGKDSWKNIEQWDHLNHAMNHINEWNRGDRSEPHLVNAMARLTFALWQAVENKEQPDTYIHPDEVK